MDTITLLDRVLTRLSLTPDEKLSEFADQFLVAVIHKLSDPSVEARKKAHEVLTFFMPRVSHNTAVHLPYADIVNECLLPKEISLAEWSVALVFAKMGMNRVRGNLYKEKECAKLVEKLMSGNGARDDARKNAVYQLHLDFVLAPSRESLPKCDYLTTDEDVLAWVEFATDILLIGFVPALADKAAAVPGLSLERARKLFGGMNLKECTGTEVLAQWKLGIVRIFVSESIADNEHAIAPLLIASIDGSAAVASKAEDALKRLGPDVHESKRAVERLFSLFAGSEKDLRPPANPVLRGKIVAFLSRSLRAASSPLSVHAAFQCLWGEGATRSLRAQGMTFMRWVVAHMAAKVMAAAGPVILSGLRRVLAEESDPQLRGFAFSILGDLARRLPGPFTSDISLIKLLFQSLVSEPHQDVRLCVLEALSAVRSIIAPIGASSALSPEGASSSSHGKGKQVLSSEVTRELERFLVEESERKHPGTNHLLACVQWSREIFPIDHILSRYICIIGISDEKPDVVEESKKGLIGAQECVDPGAFCSLVFQRKQDLLADLPFSSRFLDFVNKALSLSEKWKKEWYLGDSDSLSSPGSGSLSSSGSLSQSDNALSLSPERKTKGILWKTWDLSWSILRSQYRSGGNISKISLENATEFIILLLHRTKSQISPHETENPENPMEIEREREGDLSRALSLFVSQIDGELLSSIIVEPGPSSNCKDLSTRILLYAPDKEKYVDRFADMIERSHFDERERERLTEKHREMGLSEERARMKRERQVAGIAPSKAQVRDAESESAMLRSLGYLSSLSHSPLLLSIMERHLSSESDDSIPLSLSLSAAEALGALSSLVPKSRALDGALETYLSLCEKLRKREDDPKSLERLLGALSLFIFGRDSEERERCVERLTGGNFSDFKSDETQFAMGEVLACAGGDVLTGIGEKSLSYLTTSKIRNSTSSGSLSIIDRVMKLLVSKDQSLLSRCAIGIWLLSLTKFTPPSVINYRLKELSDIFLYLLTDNNDMTQEVASKGLGMCYDLSEERERESLVKALIDNLAGNVSSTGPLPKRKLMDDKGNLTVELEIPLPNSNGKISEKMSTYREICSAATEMGQPDLIYKFLDMVGSQSSWNSKRGTAFGISNIMSKNLQNPSRINQEIEKLIPKLYRYQFDPNLSIQSAMNKIWRDLVKDPKKTVISHFREIFEEIERSSVSRLWRVREAALSALIDLVSVVDERDFNALSLWKISLTAVDDIKESVRERATKLCDAVGKLTVKLSRSLSLSLSLSWLDEVIMYLIREGVESKVRERVAISLKWLVEICKEAGEGLTRVVGEATGSLLENMSSLEAEELNYLTFHAGDSLDMLERARVMASSSTPVSEALNMLLRQTNDENGERVIHRMTALVRQGIGLPTKAAVAKTTVKLASIFRYPKNPDLFNDLIVAITLALGDRSLVIRELYAEALSHLIRCVPRKVRDDVINRLIAMYQPWKVDGAPEIRHIVSLVFLRMSRVSGDVFKDYQAEIMSLSTMGAADPDEASALNFQNILEENQSSLSLVVKEILSLAEKCISGNSYTGRVQGMKLISGDKFLSKVSDEELSLCIQWTRSLSLGNVWKGKESVTKTAVLLIEENNKRKNEAIKKECEKLIYTMLKSCAQLLVKRDIFNKEYLSLLSLSLGKISQVFDIKDIFSIEKLKEITENIEKEKTNNDNDNNDQNNIIEKNQSEKDKIIDIFLEKSIESGNSKEKEEIVDEDLSRAQRRQLENDTKVGCVKVISALCDREIHDEKYQKIISRFSFGAKHETVPVRIACIASEIPDSLSLIECLDEIKSLKVREIASSVLEKRKQQIQESDSLKRSLEERVLRETDLTVRDKLMAILRK